MPTKPEPALPSVKEIVGRYIEALGGEDALTKITTRAIKASRIGADGVLVPEEVYQKQPDKILTITSYPNIVFSNGFNGKSAWGHSSKDGVMPLPDQVLNQLKVDAVFNKELKTEEIYSKLTMTGRADVNGSETYVIQATPLNGSPEKLFFDVHSGLLLRRYVESDNVFGKFPLQTDYDDYREIDGVKQPFLIRWSFPGRSWGRKVQEIKQNIPIDDSKFNPPPK